MEEFTTQGGYFAPLGYMKVEAGGSHEENPNGGVQVGADSQGVPNLLEEGEPVYKDYVYSDNITISDEMIEKHSLPKKLKGKLYSECADWFVDEAEDRPLDSISNNGLNAMLMRLADAQEEQKALKEQADLEEELANMSPEELAELEAALGQQEMQMPEDMILSGQEQMFRYGGRKFAWGGNTDDDDERPLRRDPHAEEVVPIVIQPTEAVVPPSVVRRKYRDPHDEELGITVASESTNSPAVPGTTSATRRAIAPVGPQIPEGYIVTPDMVQQIIDDDIYLEKVLDDRARGTNRLSAVNNAVTKAVNRTSEPNRTPSMVDYTGPRYQEGQTKVVEKEDGKLLPTWQRYAGIAAAGLAGIHNALQEPDHYNIPRINPVLPSQRMHLIDPTFTPMDINLSANEVLASNAGTLRALENAGLGGTTAAAMLAADYNATGALGKARAQVFDANNAARNQVIALRNQNGSTLGNFYYGQDRDRATFLNDAMAKNAQNSFAEQRANYDAESMKYAALQTQLDAMAEGLAGIGRENVFRNQINELGRRGVFLAEYDEDGRIVPIKQR